MREGASGCLQLCSNTSVGPACEDGMGGKITLDLEVEGDFVR